MVREPGKGARGRVYTRRRSLFTYEITEHGYFRPLTQFHCREEEKRDQRPFGANRIVLGHQASNAALPDDREIEMMIGGVYCSVGSVTVALEQVNNRGIQRNTCFFL